MIEPRRWTLPELERDAEEAESAFREERLREPLHQYSEFFERFAAVFRELVDRLPTLAHAEDPAETIIEIVSEEDARTALRYLAAPPISDDDLKTLAETKLSAAALRSTPENARRIAALVFRLIDPHRFPWVTESRLPTSDEVERAVVASAALVATQKVATSRRSASKVQEDAVKDVLRSCGFIEDPPRPEIERWSTRQHRTASEARASWAEPRPTSWSVWPISGFWRSNARCRTAPSTRTSA